MSLLLPILDDKPFGQIAEEGRLLIPSTAPEWTDHNVHDPGITFVELFAWLAEIEHYRLNRTAATTYERFFSLMGLSPLPARAATVRVPFELAGLTTHVLIPAGSRLNAIGLESTPFQTAQDQFLTIATLKRVVTHSGDREVVETAANIEDGGHFDAFGPDPKINDSLLLEFNDWFTEPQAQLEITLFENDLPKPLRPLTDNARGFYPSATVGWEYRGTPVGNPPQEWTPLEVIKDGTLNFTRSGDLVFRVPLDAIAAANKQLRAVLVAGHHEIPPRIANIRTNVLRGKQVETFVNESLGDGTGAADQTVRLKNAPLFIDATVYDGPFQVGEVLDWNALVLRLNNGYNYAARQRDTLRYLFLSLSTEAQGLVLAKAPPNNSTKLTDDEKFALAQAFNELIEKRDFYRKDVFQGIDLSSDCLDTLREQSCLNTVEIRRCNRNLLQKVFRDLFVGDRLEIQTRVAGTLGEDEGLTWISWEAVESFDRSGPDDRHYIVEQATGVINFGNGLNGRVPQPSEAIRARFYRYSQLENGNVPANRQWRFAVQLPLGTVVTNGKNLEPAEGGTQGETLDETKSRCRAVFRKEAPVLTVPDYENAVKNTPGLRVARVKVIPNFNPSLPCLKMPGEVTIIVEPYPAPRQAFPNAAPALASPGFLKTVRNNLEQGRLVTTNIHVEGPRFVPINVSCSVFLKKRVSISEALEKITRSLSDFFDPVFGGPDNERGWPFGRSVFPSEISQRLAAVPGVDYVKNVRVNDQVEWKAFKLKYDELPRSGIHSIKPVIFESRNSQNSAKRMNCE
jgi:Baseplate J-like protein